MAGLPHHSGRLAALLDVTEMGAQARELALLEAEPKELTGEFPPKLPETKTTFFAACSASACSARLKGSLQGQACRLDPREWLPGHPMRARVSEPYDIGSETRMATVACD